MIELQANNYLITHILPIRYLKDLMKAKLAWFLS